MSRALASGEYFGRVAHRFECEHALVADVVHGCACALPEHDHGATYFSLLLRGRYADRTARREHDYDRFDVAFLPRGVPHRDAVGDGGARLLCLELKGDDAMAEELADDLDPARLSDEMAALMLRLHAALHAHTLSALGVESVAWELVGAARRMRALEERALPRWLARCAERVREDVATSYTARELALEAGVHPVHLAREFRRRFRQTLGEYAHRARLRRACDAIGRGDATLADIAASVGFSDQAHFCRVFKATIGVSPSAFRRSLASEPGAAAPN